MNLIEALERVHSLALAQLSLLVAESDEMDGPPEKHAEAMATFEDFVVNHWEQVEQDHGLQISEANLPAAIGPGDLDALRSSVPAGPLNDGFMTALELAVGQHDPETNALNQKAVALVAAFWRDHGKSITDRMVVIPIDHVAPA